MNMFFSFFNICNIICKFGNFNFHTKLNSTKDLISLSSKISEHIIRLYSLQFEARKRENPSNLMSNSEDSEVVTFVPA